MKKRRLAGELKILGNLIAIENKPNSQWDSEALWQAAEIVRSSKAVKYLTSADFPSASTRVLKSLDQLKGGNECYLHSLIDIPRSTSELIDLKLDIPLVQTLIEGEIESLEDLEDSVEAGTLVDVLSKKDVKTVEKALSSQDNSDISRIPLFKAKTVARYVVQELISISAVDAIAICGSIRRGKPLVRDIDIVCVCESERKNEVKKLFTSLGRHTESFNDRHQINLDADEFEIPVDLYMCDRKNYGASLLFTTGSRQHNNALRERFEIRGLAFSRYGIWHRGVFVGGRTEREIYSKLRVPYHPPEARESLRLTIPREDLVSYCDYDLNIHSKFSDGKNTAKSMIEAAISKGLTIVGITDHWNKVKHDLGRYLRILDKYKKTYAGKILILSGITVDVDRKGNVPQLDHKLLDFVSMRVGKDPDHLPAKRLTTAIDNTPGTYRMIVTPTRRRLGKRLIPKSDWVKLFTKVASSGRIIQINSNPRLLDLPARLLPSAKQCGCKFNIDSGAHEISTIGSISPGIINARRGLLTAKDMITHTDLLYWKRRY